MVRRTVRALPTIQQTLPDGAEPEVRGGGDTTSFAFPRSAAVETKLDLFIRPHTPRVEVDRSGLIRRLGGVCSAGDCEVGRPVESALRGARRLQKRQAKQKPDNKGTGIAKLLFRRYESTIV